MTRVYTSLTKAELRAVLAKLPKIMAGTEPDVHGLGAAFSLGFAIAVYSTISEAFVVKARGGTDEAGISWPPLSREYIAYGRRPGRNFPTTPDLEPSSALTDTQRKRWWALYKQSLAWMSEDGVPKKGRAAARAWKKGKEEGMQSKLDKYGDTEVEILRDTGILLNSLSPTILMGANAHAGLNESGSDQETRYSDGRLTVGTTCAYAKYHHYDKNGVGGKGRRPLWPPDDEIPDAWTRDWTEAGLQALFNRLKEIAPQIAQGRL